MTILPQHVPYITRIYCGPFLIEMFDYHHIIELVYFHDGEVIAMGKILYSLIKTIGNTNIYR